MRKLLFLFLLSALCISVKAQLVGRSIYNNTMCDVIATYWCISGYPDCIVSPSAPITVTIPPYTNHPIPSGDLCSTSPYLYMAVQLCWPSNSCPGYCATLDDEPITSPPTPTCYPDHVDFYPPCPVCGSAQLVYNHATGQFFIGN